MNSNESPWDISDEAKYEIVSRTAWNRYPPAESEVTLTKRLAEYLMWEPGNIILTNGGDEAILLLTIVSGGEVVLSRPGFGVPERVARALGRKVEAMPPRDIPLCTGGLAWLISPHNPLGFLYDPAEIASAAENYGLVGVDCAYWEFSETRPWEAVPQKTNIAYIGTFSKACGIASLRLGYILATDGISEKIRQARLDYPVNGVAIAAASWILAEPELVKRRTKTIISERERLKKSLAGLVDDLLDTRTNFVTFRARPGLKEDLERKGILIREYDVGLYRVTVGKPEENEAFLLAVKEIL